MNVELTPLDYRDYPDTDEGREQMQYDIGLRLLAQGGPSLDNGICLYRGPNGRRCGVGWVIPDSLVGELTFVDDLPWPDDVSEVTIATLARVQDAHDGAARQIKAWAGSLYRTAQAYNLPGILRAIEDYTK